MDYNDSGSEGYGSLVDHSGIEITSDFSCLICRIFFALPILAEKPGLVEHFFERRKLNTGLIF